MPVIVSHPNSKTEPRRLCLCWGAPTPLPFANAQTRAPTTAFCTIRPSIGPLSILSHHRFALSTQNRAPVARFAQGCTTPTSLRDRINVAASPPSPPCTRIRQGPNYPHTSPLAAPQQKPSPSGSIGLGCTTTTFLCDHVNVAAPRPSTPRIHIRQGPNYSRTSSLAAPKQKPSPSGSVCSGCTTLTSLHDRVNAASPAPSPPCSRTHQDQNYLRTSPLAAPKQKLRPGGSVLGEVQSNLLFRIF